MKKVISPEALIETLGARYATKMFDSTAKISEEDMNALKESLRLAPSSYGLQPWQFIVVETPATRTTLRAASWNQGQVEDASHYVVFTTLRNVDVAHVEKYIASMAATRSIPTESLAGYRDMMVNAVANNTAMNHLAWTQRQAYIAMGFIGLSAALLGIDTCMLEGISPADYDKILGLEGTPYTAVAAIALGYRHADDKTAHYAKSRFSADEVIKTV